MIIEEKDFREAVRSVVKGVFVIVALIILERVACALLKVQDTFWGMTPNAWIEVIISVVIVGMAIKLYRPVKTIVTFYLAALVKVGRLPGRDKYLSNLVAAAGNLTLFAFVIAVYTYILPAITQCNDAFIHFRSLTTVLNITILVIAVGVLFILWKNAQPLIDILTGHITDKVSNVSSGIAYVDCPSCRAKNDRDATFCVSCGGPMQQKAVAAPTKNGVCPQCSADNPPASKFCHKCGSAI